MADETRVLGGEAAGQTAECPRRALLPVQWQGTSLTDPPPARELLRQTAYIRERLTPGQVKALGDFYTGQEQDADTLSIRTGNRRPTLTVNLLPALVARMISDAAREGKTLTDEERTDLVIIVTLLNRDAQRLYNYLLSAAAECCGVCPRTLRFHPDCFALVWPAVGEEPKP